MSCAHAGEPQQTSPSFAALDIDRNGFISSQEAHSRRGLRYLFEFFDADLDGRLSRKEYKQMLKDAAHAIEALAKQEKPR